MKKTEHENTEKAIIRENILIGDQSPAEFPRIKRDTIWEGLHQAIKTYVGSKTNDTRGDWVLFATKSPLGFIVIYDNIKCFPVEFVGPKTFTIGDRMDSDMKNYIAIGNKICKFLMEEGCSVTNVKTFGRIW